MTAPSAKIITDSVSPSGHRLTTFEVVMHRFVLAECNTHRAFSRNSASSRARPVAKTIEQVLTDPAFPLVWPAEQKGMQGGADLASGDQGEARGLWLKARDEAVEAALAMCRLGLHKSVVNRIIEPFMWHTAIISATDLDGFWRQRCSPLAQPEMRALAEAMRVAYDMSDPMFVAYGEWHLPYIQPNELDEYDEIELRQISAARCARVSYLTHAGVRDPSEDLSMYARLVSADPPHASPLEHVAMPTEIATSPGNFTGWLQLRHGELGW